MEAANRAPRVLTPANSLIPREAPTLLQMHASWPGDASETHLGQSGAPTVQISCARPRSSDPRP